MRRQPALTTIFLLAATPCLAQQPARGLCWRAPTADCEFTLLTEISYQRVLATTQRRVAFTDGTVTQEKSRGVGSHLTWEVGLLKSIGARDAVGLTYEFGASFEALRHGVRLRGRRFIAPRTSVEVGAGLARAEVGSFVGQEAVGFTVDARINVEDKLSVLVGYDNFDWPELNSPYYSHVDPADRAQALKLGVASGSWTGLLATGVVGVAYLLLALAYAGST